MKIDQSLFYKVCKTHYEIDDKEADTLYLKIRAQAEKEHLIPDALFFMHNFLLHNSPKATVEKYLNSKKFV